MISDARARGSYSSTAFPLIIAGHLWRTAGKFANLTLSRQGCCPTFKRDSTFRGTWHHHERPWCDDRTFNFVMDDKSDVCVISRWCALRCVRFNRRREGALLWSSRPSTNERSLRLIAVESWLCNRRYHRALLLVHGVVSGTTALCTTALLIGTATFARSREISHALGETCREFVWTCLQDGLGSSTDRSFRSVNEFVLSRVRRMDAVAVIQMKMTAFLRFYVIICRAHRGASLTRLLMKEKVLIARHSGVYLINCQNTASLSLKVAHWPW